ncbi:MAG TPA: NUDIX domain-containing protein [Micromonosporaceae bacterium]
MPHVVAGALVASGRVLLGHRCPSRRWYPDVWDLPGGHVEPGESESDALARELREELGVQIVQSECVALRGIDLPDASGDGAVRLTVWRVPRWAGTPVNLCPEEHDELGWFRAADLDDLALAHPSYRPMLGALLD